MGHLGIICPPIPGHLNPLCVLGRTLIRRGHRVTVFHVSDVGPKVKEEGLGFVALGASEFPAGSLAESIASMKELRGLQAVRFAVKEACRTARLILEQAPDAFEQAGVTAVLVDQNEPAGGTVAEHLRLPFVSVCTSLPINREASIPPSFVAWSHGGGAFSRLRNQLAYRVADYLVDGVQTTLNEFRAAWGLPLLRSPDDSFSRLAQIAQMPRELDFPRSALSREFHYTGPWLDDSSCLASDFPFERLDGRPLIYASLGTLQSSASAFFPVVAAACSGLSFQVVISAGSEAGAALPVVSADCLVAHFAPQIELLKRAALTITHAGMNTTAQALHFGCPLIAVPMTHDQPAIAARLKRTGAGLVISPGRLTMERLRSAVNAVLEQPGRWRAEARRMQAASERAGGAEAAADIIEKAIPALRSKSAHA